MIVQMYYDDCVRLSAGFLSVCKACEECSFVVYDNGQCVGSFKDAISFDRFMKKEYGEFGERVAGLLCWYVRDYLDDEEIEWLVKENRVFRVKRESEVVGV